MPDIKAALQNTASKLTQRDAQNNFIGYVPVSGAVLRRPWADGCAFAMHALSFHTLSPAYRMIPWSHQQCCCSICW